MRREEKSIGLVPQPARGKDDENVGTNQRD